MRIALVLPALTWLVATSLSASAADLTKIDRTIAREPAYQSKTPRYCLVVFGAEAKARMWLVLDDKILYVDRNGDSDLTGADERIEVKPPRGVFETKSLKPAGSEYEYSNLLVRIKDKDCCEINLSRKVDFAHRKRVKDSLTIMAGITGISSRSWMSRDRIEEHDFRFGDSAKVAPVVHIDGPLTLRPMFTNQVFVRGDESSRFPVIVGTPGVGKSTFTQVLFWQGDPDGVAEIVFPPRDAKGKPIVVKVALKSPD